MSSSLSPSQIVPGALWKSFHSDVRSRSSTRAGHSGAGENSDGRSVVGLCGSGGNGGNGGFGGNGGDGGDGGCSEGNLFGGNASQPTSQSPFSTGAAVAIAAVTTTIATCLMLALFLYLRRCRGTRAGAHKNSVKSRRSRSGRISNLFADTVTLASNRGRNTPQDRRITLERESVQPNGSLSTTVSSVGPHTPIRLLQPPRSRSELLNRVVASEELSRNLRDGDRVSSAPNGENRNEPAELEVEIRGPSSVSRVAYGEQPMHSEHQRNSSVQGMLGLHGVAQDDFRRHWLPAYSGASHLDGSTPPPSYS